MDTRLEGKDPTQEVSENDQFSSSVKQVIDDKYIIDPSKITTDDSYKESMIFNLVKSLN